MESDSRILLDGGVPRKAAGLVCIGLTTLILLSLTPSGISAVYDTLQLNPPALTNGNVSLTLRGESAVTYVVEASTNLQTWTPIITNADTQLTRTLDLGAATETSFFRTARKRLPVFSSALAATNQIDFNSGNVSTDSFDSADPAHSINGQYPFGQPSMVKSNADIVSSSSVTNSFAGGSQFIRGKVRTGPEGTVNLGTNGYVTGGIYDDFNVVFPDVVLPATSWLPGAYVFTNIGGFSYDYVFTDDGDYTIPGDFSNGFFVGTNAHVRVKITSSVTVMNLQNDGIRIAPGGSLTIYMLGTQFKIAGRGIVNDSGNAANFYLFGLPSCTDIQFNGNQNVTGCIYAPRATFTMGGGGNNTNDFIGASVTKSVKMNGHFNFHYDENLQRVGPTR